MSLSWPAENGSFFSVDGVRLEYRAVGPSPADGPIFLLLHEGLGSTALWRGFEEKLSDATGWGVISYSRAGYGKSDPVTLPRPLDYMTREAMDVVPGVLDVLAGQDVVLLGHSDGASISAIYAGVFEDPRIKGVILLAPHFFTEPEGLVAIAEAKSAFETTNLKDKLGKYHAHPEIAFRGWNDSWLHPDFKDWNIASYLNEVKVPVLAVQGYADQYGTMAQLAEVKDRVQTPVTLLKLEECGHAPHLEKPDETLAGIRKFVSTLGLATTPLQMAK
ncbi:alpha/beta fold hydrolase [Sneathiella limimaris]|uniref:alpha/beta fold hydrolase n=1 Tax=Sneathiella limimaris TaxID=1964213 RepID=UPI00146F53F6|nr:alpha/beta hydrolase [Sneathiella limimaris]